MLKVLWKEAMKVHLAQRCLSWFGKLGACPSCSFVSGATTVPSMWKLMKRFHRAVKIPCAHAIGAGNMSQENERMCGEPSSAKLSGIKSGWCFLSTDVGLLCVQNLLWWLLRFLFLFFFLNVLENVSHLTARLHPMMKGTTLKLFYCCHSFLVQNSASKGRSLCPVLPTELCQPCFGTADHCQVI